MPQRQKITLVGQQAKDKHAQVNNQQTLNLVASIKEPGAKARVVLESAPGLVELGAAGDGPCRSPSFVQWRHPTDGTLDTYAVFGSHLVRMSTLNGFTSVGSLAALTTPVRIARGRTYLMIVDGVFGYTWDGSTFAQITDLDFPQASSTPIAAPTHCVYQDGFFIVNDANSDNFHISDIEDPTSWNALEFDAAAVAPDNALALANTESELWILGDETCQAYYNSGNAIFPYAIILSATQEVGVLAPYSVAESDAGIFFLATTPEGGRFVYQIRGQSGQKISTEEIEDELDGMEDFDCAYAFIYKQAGKSFYVLTLDRDKPTFVWNIGAGAWETRSMVDGSAWRIGGHGIFNGDNVGGSRLAGRVYRLDRNHYTDSGTDFVRRRVTQVQHANNHELDWHELVVVCQAGVGNPADPGSNPQLRLRYSDDGGEVWSRQLLEPLGKIGQGLRRAVYRSLGQARNRIFELEFSDPTDFTIIDAYGYATVLED